MKKFIKQTGLMSAASVLACTTLLCVAQAKEQGFYFGASVGPSDLDSSDGISFSDETGYKITGGYQVNQFLAFEASYWDFGKFDADNTVVPASIDVDGYEFALVGTYDINDAFGIYGRLGYFSGDADTDVGNVSVSDDFDDASYGIGASYNFYQNMEATIDYNIVSSDPDLEYWGFGIRYRF